MLIFRVLKIKVLAILPVRTCSNADCEDLTQAPSTLGQCVAPADALSCQQQGNCAIGVNCAADDELMEVTFVLVVNVLCQ